MKIQFTNIFETENNIILYILLVYVAFNAWWLSSKELISGTLYFSLFTGIFILVLAFTIFKKENKYTFPIFMTRHNNVAIARYYLGFIFGAIVLIIGSAISPIFTQISTQAFRPLNSFKSTQAEATFSALEAQNSPFWTMNTIVNFASIFEEILIGVLLVYIFYVIIVALFKNISQIKALWISIFIDIIAFAVLHSFNSTYTSFNMYLVAAGFRLVTNILIYVVGFGVEFTIGVHALNNALFLGLTTVMSGLFSFGGLFFLALNFVFIYVLFTTTHDWGDLFRKISYKIGGT